MRAVCSALILIFLMTSCAVTRDHVSIQYEPIKDVAKIEKADAIPIEVQVNDLRPSKERVGRKKNGYGMDCASIMCKNNISLLVKEAISQELQNRGFRLSSSELSANLIEVDLHKFYNEFKSGFWSGKAASEVVLQVKVQNRKQGYRFSKTIIGTGINKGVMFASGENARLGLEEALKSAISNLVNDPSFIDSLLRGENSSTATAPSEDKANKSETSTL